MKPKMKFELWRWGYFVILFLVGTALIFLIAEVVAGPVLRWLLYDIPYALPTWTRAGRMAIAVLFISFVAGTVAWYYEKCQSGR